MNQGCFGGVISVACDPPLSPLVYVSAAITYQRGYSTSLCGSKSRLEFLISRVGADKLLCGGRHKARGHRTAAGYYAQMQRREALLIYSSKEAAVISSGSPPYLTRYMPPQVADLSHVKGKAKPNSTEKNRALR